MLLGSTDQLQLCGKGQGEGVLCRAPATWVCTQPLLPAEFQALKVVVIPVVPTLSSSRALLTTAAADTTPVLGSQALEGAFEAVVGAVP